MQNPLNGILSRLIKLIFKHPKFVQFYSCLYNIAVPCDSNFWNSYFLLKLLFMLCKLIDILSLQNNINIERLSVAIQINVISLKCSFHSFTFV